MNVLILNEKGIEKLFLPKTPSGVYYINYIDDYSDQEIKIGIEANNNKWFIKSNDLVYIDSEGPLLNEKELKEFDFFNLIVKKNQKKISVFCCPTEENFDLKMSTNFDRLTIGSANGNDIQLPSELVKSIHAIISKEEGEWVISTSGEKDCYLYLNNKRILKSKLNLGDSIFIYGLKIIWMDDYFILNQPSLLYRLNENKLSKYIEESTISLKPYDEKDEVLDASLYEDSDFFFHTPRLSQKVEPKELFIDEPPAKEVAEERHILMVLGPAFIMIGSSMMMFTMAISSLNSGRSLYLVIPMFIMAIGMILGVLIFPRIVERMKIKKAKKREEFRQKKYTEYLDLKEKEINNTILEQQQILKQNNLSPEECLSNFKNNESNFWMREVYDEDFGSFRLGLGSINAALTVRGPEERFSLDEDALHQRAVSLSNKQYTIENAPIVFSLVKNRISAIVSEDASSIDYVKTLILQLLYYHSPSDLKLVFLLDETANKDWDFAKYLPHTLSEDKKVRYFANNNEDIKIVLSEIEIELINKISLRSENTQDDGDLDKRAVEEKGKSNESSYKKMPPYYILITNNYMKIKDIPTVTKIMNLKDNLGFSVLLLEKNLKRLTNKCETFIQFEPKQGWVMKKVLNDQITYRPELISDLNLRQVGDKLLNIPIAKNDASSELPKSLSFNDMYNISKIEQYNILKRWEENNPINSLRAIVGVHASGEQFYLDLHEKYHGPHGLIAGSTGSGKSEFIITMLLSMAINYHPEEVQFVIIDYKGGGLAGAFENKKQGVYLPHSAGAITNLDLSELNRTLVSINSEMKRRQAKFNEVRELTGESTMDIYKYQKLYRDGIINEPISHLMIVADEFAELKTQQPEFMAELISAARIGRSLGIHLILATQKPAGVVNDQIWSNARFKVCLKVQSRTDSMEMLKRPEAASLKEVGRYYLQVGYNEYFEIGQSGWAGEKYVPSDKIIKKVDTSLNYINNVGQVIKSSNNEIKKESKEDLGDQLTNIVRYISKISNDKNIKQNKIWLDRIPDFVLLGELLMKYNYNNEKNTLKGIIGEYDFPEAQEQGLLEIDFKKLSNVLIYGQTGSGKENLLTTMLYTLISGNDEKSININLFDFGTAGLSKFSSFPQINNYVGADEEEKLIKTLESVSNELENRKKLFKDYNGSWFDYNEGSGKQVPLMINVLNSYEILAELDYRISEGIYSLIRDGQKYGILFVVTTSVANSIKTKVTELFQYKMALQMPNITDYQHIIGAPRGKIPHKSFGRGIIKSEDFCYEFQTAFLAEKSKINEFIKMNTPIESTKETSISKITVDELKDYNKGSKSMPLGIDYSSNQVIAYNFASEKITPILMNNLFDNKNIINAYLSQLVRFSRVNVIDFNNVLKADDIKGCTHIASDFEKVLSLIYEIIAVKKDFKDERVYAFVGLGSIREKLDKKAIKIIEFLIINAKKIPNTTIIIFDDYNNYKKLSIESWYPKITGIKGIWLGKWNSTQALIDFDGISTEHEKVDENSISYAKIDEEVKLIKSIVIEGGA